MYISLDISYGRDLLFFLSLFCGMDKEDINNKMMMKMMINKKRVLSDKTTSDKS